MDFQHRVGSKTGGGGAAGWSESDRDRKERLRKLALETIDLSKVCPLHTRLFYDELRCRTPTSCEIIWAPMNASYV